MNKGESQEAGSSILGAIVALGIIGAVITFYATGTANQTKARRNIEQKEQYLSIELAVANEAAAIIRTLTPSNCLSKAVLLERPFAFRDSGAKLRLVEKLDTNQAPAQMNDVHERCKTPLLISPLQVNNAAYSRLHFCMIVDTAGEVRPSDQTLVEYEIQLFSTGGQTPLSCAQFQLDRSAVAHVAYGIHVSEDGGRSVKHGITVARNAIGDEL